MQIPKNEKGVKNKKKKQSCNFLLFFEVFEFLSFTVEHFERNWRRNFASSVINDAIPVEFLIEVSNPSVFHELRSSVS